MTDVAEVLFLDLNRLNTYGMQLDGKIPFLRRIGLKLGFSFAGIQFGAERPVSSAERNAIESCRDLMNVLSATGQLAFGRPADPEYTHDPPRKFVLEKDIFAQKFIVPLAGLPGLTETIVWISRPHDKHLNGQGYGEGTYLYLIEDHWSDENYTHMVSGCSALQCILREFCANDAARGSNRGDYRTPEETLWHLGAKALSIRKIAVFYRIRYFSDEQFFEIDGHQHRSYDLVGYPIAIIEA